MPSRPPKTPDLTPAQKQAGIAAGVAATANIMRAWVDIPPEAVDNITTVAVVYGPSLIGVDFGLRAIRGKYDVFSKRIEEPEDAELRRWSMRAEVLQGVAASLSFAVALTALVLALT
jgi:hypothetical protein